MTAAVTTPSGRLRMAVRSAPKPALTLDVARRYGLAQPGQPGHVKAWKRDNEHNLERGLRDLERIEAGRSQMFMGALWATVHRIGEPPLDLGLISARVVTTTGVGFIVDAWQNLVELENMKYHGIGTGAAAEASSDTALGTEATTQYNPNSTRSTGTLAEGASANIFESVGTVTVDASIAVTEHGLFSQAATGGGVLFDRSVFSVINLASGEGITFTYDCTLPAGS